MTKRGSFSKRGKPKKARRDYISSDDFSDTSLILEDDDDDNLGSLTERDVDSTDGEPAASSTYNWEELCKKKAFDLSYMFVKLSPEQFTMDYIRKDGLSTPILFSCPPSQLGMTIPDGSNFDVSTILELLGGKQIVEIINVENQEASQMVLEDFVEYYKRKPEDRDALYNVLSLEFSSTRLAELVHSPSLVQELDWIDLYWPKDGAEKKKPYPKVQFYCIMSVKGCFTDFHVDFAGTSVWYHIMKGRKIFWMVEPTESNLTMYEEWILKGNDNLTFYGDIADKCVRIEIREGQTFIVPSGWIHCAYTPEDSLVFGGNFLHSFSIPLQLRSLQSENKLRIGLKYRFPYYNQTLWYVVIGIVEKATGRSYWDRITPENKGSSVKNLSKEADKSGDFVEYDIRTEKTMEVEAKNDYHAKDSKLIDGNEEGCIGSTLEIDKSVKGMPCPQQLTEDPVMASGFSSENSELHFNDEYIATLSTFEINGFTKALQYLRKISAHSSNIVPFSDEKMAKQLLTDFKLLIDYVVKKNKDALKKEEESKKAKVAANKTPIAKSSKMKVPQKRRSTSLQIHKAKRMKQKKSDTSGQEGLHIVGGLPPPIMPPDAPQAPNPYGYDPLASVTPLGHKQLPSAYRRTPDMAALPPAVKYRRQYQAKSETDGVLDVIAKESSSSLQTLDPPQNALEHPKTEVELTVAEDHSKKLPDSTSTFPTVSRTQRLGRLGRNSIHETRVSSNFTKKISYPELEYKSPLARTAPPSTKQSNPKVCNTKSLFRRDKHSPDRTSPRHNPEGESRNTSTSRDAAESRSAVWCQLQTKSVWSSPMPRTSPDAVHSFRPPAFDCESSSKSPRFTMKDSRRSKDDGPRMENRWERLSTNIEKKDSDWRVIGHDCQFSPRQQFESTTSPSEMWTKLEGPRVPQRNPFTGSPVITGSHDSLHCQKSIAGSSIHSISPRSLEDIHPTNVFTYADSSTGEIKTNTATISGVGGVGMNIQQAEIESGLVDSAKQMLTESPKSPDVSTNCKEVEPSFETLDYMSTVNELAKLAHEINEESSTNEVVRRRGETVVISDPRRTKKTTADETFEVELNIGSQSETKKQELISPDCLIEDLTSLLDEYNATE